VFAFFALTEGFIADYFQGARRARNAYTYPIGPAIGRELFGDDFDRLAEIKGSLATYPAFNSGVAFGSLDGRTYCSLGGLAGTR
jgi:hypothetical protein